MRLKRIKKDEAHNLDMCAVSRCRQQAELVYDIGVAWPAKEGKVGLCGRHAEARELERTQEAADAPPPAPEPEGEFPVAPLMDIAVRKDAELEAAEAEETLQMLRDMPVAGQADIDFANECLGDVKGKVKRLKKIRTETTKPLRDVLDTMRGWFASPLALYEQAEQILKSKIRDGMDSLEAQRTAQIAAASQAHQQGDLQAVQALVGAANAAEVHQPDNVTRTEHYAFRVDAPDLVPRELCSPDERKIRAYLSIHKAAAIGAVAGVTVWREDIIGRRGA
jgi:hypothetical protein